MFLANLFIRLLFIHNLNEYGIDAIIFALVIDVDIRHLVKRVLVVGLERVPYGGVVFPPFRG